MSKVWYQGILKATVSGVFEDLKFKIWHTILGVLLLRHEAAKGMAQIQDGLLGIQ